MKETQGLAMAEIISSHLIYLHYHCRVHTVVEIRMIMYFYSDLQLVSIDKILFGGFYNVVMAKSKAKQDINTVSIITYVGFQPNLISFLLRSPLHLRLRPPFIPPLLAPLKHLICYRLDRRIVQVG